MTKEEIFRKKQRKRIEKLKLAKYCPKKPGFCWNYHPKVKPTKIEE